MLQSQKSYYQPMTAAVAAKKKCHYQWTPSPTEAPWKIGKAEMGVKFEM